MKAESWSEYTNEALQKELKKLKNGKLINAFIVGATIGIFLYSSVTNGFGLMTFFPLAIAYLIIKNSKNDSIIKREIEEELKSRNLK